MEGQTGEDIVEKLDKILERMNVSQEQILTLATDGASNEVAAGNHEFFCPNAIHIWCVNHTG